MFCSLKKNSFIYPETKYAFNWSTTPLKAIPVTFYLPVSSDYISLRCEQTFNVLSNVEEISICFKVAVTLRLCVWSETWEESSLSHVPGVSGAAWIWKSCGVFSQYTLGIRRAAISGQFSLWSPATAWQSISLSPIWCHGALQRHQTSLEPRSAQTHASQPHGCVSIHSRKALKCWQCFSNWKAD